MKKARLLVLVTLLVLSLIIPLFAVVPDPEPEPEYSYETAVAIGSNTKSFANSWQSIYNIVNADKLTTTGIKLNIIAGQYYKVGEVTVYKNTEGNVAVKYVLFNGAVLDDASAEAVKIGINDTVKEITVPNGRLKSENLKKGTVYVRVHFDVAVDKSLMDGFDIR